MTASETSPLLPPGKTQVFHGSVDVSESETLAPSNSALAPQPTNPDKFSRADLIWILTGLWSGVFLAALDGL